MPENKADNTKDDASKAGKHESHKGQEDQEGSKVVRVIKQRFQAKTAVSSIAGTMGMHLVSGPLVGGFFGYWLDSYFKTRWFIFIFLAFGIFAGFRMFFQDAKKLQRETEQEIEDDIEQKKEQN